MAAVVTRLRRNKIIPATNNVLAKTNRKRGTAIEAARLLIGEYRPSATPPANAAARQTTGSFTCIASNARGFQCDAFEERDRRAGWKQFGILGRLVWRYRADVPFAKTRPNRVRVSRGRRRDTRFWAPGVRPVAAMRFARGPSEADRGQSRRASRRTSSEIPLCANCA